MLMRKMKMFGFAAVVCMILVCGCGPQESGIKAESKPGKPNIIYVLVDDLGYGDLGCYGQQILQTPNIDKLAAQGVRFTNHYAGCSVSSSSRGSLMTGLHTGHAFIRGDYDIEPEGQLALPAHGETLATVLKRAGYSTAAIGEWGLGWPTSAGEPLKQGFDFFYGYNCTRLARNHYPEYLWRNQSKELVAGNQDDKQGTYCEDLFMDEALKFVEENSKGPFFLYLPFNTPSASIQAPAELTDAFAGKFGDELPYAAPPAGGFASQAAPKAAFAAMMKKLDDDMGRLMAKLDELGISGNTIIMFSSDNGPHADGGHSPDDFNSAGGLRGTKATFYEGGLKVPFIVSWPGVTTAGSVCDKISAQWDILPTFSEIASERLLAATDGISLVSDMRGAASAKHDSLYWEYKKGSIQAIRRGDWKAVRYILTGNVELYNLARDPGEISNLTPRYPAIADKLAAQMDIEHKPSEEFPLPADQ